MNFLFEEKNALFSYFDFSVLSESISFKICYIIKDITAYLKLHLQLFL